MPNFSFHSLQFQYAFGIERIMCYNFESLQQNSCPPCLCLKVIEGCVLGKQVALHCRHGYEAMLLRYGFEQTVSCLRFRSFNMCAKVSY